MMLFLFFSCLLSKFSDTMRSGQCTKSNVTMCNPDINESSNNDSSNGTPASTSINRQGRVRKVDCAIIGAGAAGLQCATRLLEGRNSSPSNKQNNAIDNDKETVSIAILEARDRIGGRVLSTHQKVKTIGGLPNEPSEVSLCRDHGAAWVHGSHESNPMMQLLVEECSFSMGQENASRILNPVFDGNAWIRPHTVLHRSGSKGEKSLISLFVDGECISDDFDEEANKDSGREPSVVSLAIIRHYRMLREILSKYNSDECHESVSEIYHQLHSKFVQSIPKEDKQGNKDLVDLLTPFYLYLMENWSGISMNDTDVDELEGFITTNSSSNEDADEGDNATLSETDEEYVSAGDFIGPHCKVKTGMITVLKPLIRTLEGHQKHTTNKMLFLGEEVLSIIDKQTHVQIETKSGNTIEAKCCVSTIPLGCLQHSISVQPESDEATKSRQPLFQPSLRDEKIEAIYSIWSGSYKKVFLTFDHIFWPEDPPIIGLLRRESVENNSESTFPGRYLLMYNLWARDKKIPSVEVILCGDLGKWANFKSDAVIQKAVLDFIETAMGLSNLSDSCTDCHVTRWEEDEFTRGSYSAFQLGTLEKHIDTLGATEWDGKLVFAGEATENDHMGSVHAALMSGQRAAQEVWKVLSSPTTTCRTTPSTAK